MESRERGLGEGREVYGCRCFSIKELAMRMGVSVEKAWRIARQPGFPLLQIGGKGSRCVIPEQLFEAWMVKRETRYAVEYCHCPILKPDSDGEPCDAQSAYKYAVIKAASEDDVGEQIQPREKSRCVLKIERIERCTDDQSAIEIVCRWMGERMAKR